ncbi:MAG: biotin-dependent carboxyltransferase family protein [Chloroflexi bacterium]|nr:biotin-dependent carboxyltransferase family protein [Chloroflexota bacterium]
MTLEFLEGGLLTTVQDVGRRGWTHVGVPESGPADPWSHAVANLLAGNNPGAATLEMTLSGPTFTAAEAVTIALAGADLGGRIRGGRPLPSGRSHRLVAGDVVELRGDPAASLSSLARAYLAVAGGVDVPVVLGSRSTCLGGGFGGFEGRPLQIGDRVPVGVPGRAFRVELVWPSPDPSPATTERVLHVLPTSRPGLEELAGRSWRVAAAADRIGIRLDASSDRGGDDDVLPDLPAALGGETLTHGVPWGAIQLPPDGRPIILGPDHQTTGGYAVVGVVITADLAILGQLRPGAPVRLATTDQGTAVAALRARRATLLAGAAALRDAAGWDLLADAAGG